MYDSAWSLNWKCPAGDFKNYTQLVILNVNVSISRIAFDYSAGLGFLDFEIILLQRVLIWAVEPIQSSFDSILSIFSVEASPTTLMLSKEFLQSSEAIKDASIYSIKTVTPIIGSSWRPEAKEEGFAMTRNDIKSMKCSQLLTFRFWGHSHDWSILVIRVFYQCDIKNLQNDNVERLLDLFDNTRLVFVLIFWGLKF